MITLFPTLISTGKLKVGNRFNIQLLKEIDQFYKKDKVGIDWSKKNYIKGYTSYASLSDMHRRSPLFSELESKLAPEIKKYAKALGWTLDPNDIEMDTCWINIMNAGAHHMLHLHPYSVISGTYYVSTPPGSVNIKFEDPRMNFYMNAPVRDMYYSVKAESSHFVLFESWLRHEVPVNWTKTPRVSISFNYKISEIE